MGELRFWRCDDCGHLLHPPSPRCPICLSKSLSITVVSGKATVFTYTVNWQPWYPNLDPPYVVAIVTIDEQQHEIGCCDGAFDLEADRLVHGLIGVRHEPASIDDPEIDTIPRGITEVAITRSERRG